MAPPSRPIKGARGRPAPAAAGGTEEPFTNRLAGEKSPYLLQHAHNPVDWRPWGEEAFAAARREDKPIFLSIGYSTCHWCHVMERESFEDDAIARLLNEHFVPIKVDREERPDVDRVYMTYVQAATGSGGWPLTVFLTPDLEPFFGGTYFPPEGGGGMTGLREVLAEISQAWGRDRSHLAESARRTADEMRNWLRAAPEGPPAGELPQAHSVREATRPEDDWVPQAMEGAYEFFRSRFDAVHGGFGSAQKFPQPVVLNFLFRHWARAGAAPARDMALGTLRALAAGGIHDHVGGGFHRYSTDERWFLPHFEKMLYDQALLTCSLLDAWQATHEEAFAAAARDTLDFVLREMTGPEGQFYSALDADSPVGPDHPGEQAEGRFYVWTSGEIEQVLGPRASATFALHYGVRPEGNAGRDPGGEFAGRNILYAERTVEETARRLGADPLQVRLELAAARAKLLEARNARPRPLLDDKSLTGWNGLAISAFARAGAALGVPCYLQAAARAADVVRRRLYADGTLYRRLREGQAAVPAFLEDYATLIQGLLDLYEASLDAVWLRWALELQARQDERFWDGQAGGCFATGDDPAILLRIKDSADGAEPSGNAVAAMNLARLAEMAADPAPAERAQRTLAIFAAPLREHPAAMPQMLCALDFIRGDCVQIVLAGRPDAPLARALLREVHAHYVPNKIILLADEAGEAQRLLPGRTEELRAARPLNGLAAAYVCRGRTCRPPTSDPAELARLVLER